jgi:hypothetical protein
MKMPPEIAAEFDRMEKICPPGHDVIATRNGSEWTVYLKKSAPLVAEPRTPDEMTTYLRHLVRSEKIDIERLVKAKEGQTLGFDEFLTDYSNL